MSQSYNSFEALCLIVEKLPAKRRAVYDAFKPGDELTNLDIATRLGWPINCVTGRTNELATGMQRLIESLPDRRAVELSDGTITHHTVYRRVVDALRERTLLDVPETPEQPRQYPKH